MPGKELLGLNTGVAGSGRILCCVGSDGELSLALAVEL